MRRIGSVFLAGILVVGSGLPAGARLAPRSGDDYAPKGMFCPGLLAFSPELRAEKTGFCMYANPFGLRLYVTHDAGRSWERARAKGLPPEAASFDTQMFLSPLFDGDRGLYLQTDKGLYVSTDMGKTFDLVEERAAATGLWMRDIEPYVEPARGLEDYDKVVFAYAGGGSNALADDAAKIDPPARIPVLGSPGSDMRFLVPRNFARTGTAFTLAHGGAGLACDDVIYCAGTTLFRCTLVFVCLDQVESFSAQLPIAAEVGNDGATPFVYVVLKGYLTGDVRVWRLRGDEGTELESVRRLMPEAPSPPYVQGTWASVSLHPEDPETVYLRWLACENPPDELASVYPDLMQQGIFRSTDAGDSWRRVGFRREWITGTPATGFTRHSTGTLPWNMRDWCAPPEIEVTSTGTVFVTAVYSREDAGTRPGPVYYGPYCSVDAGRTWARRCSRKAS